MLLKTNQFQTNTKLKRAILEYSKLGHNTSFWRQHNLIIASLWLIIHDFTATLESLTRISWLIGAKMRLYVQKKAVDYNQFTGIKRSNWKRSDLFGWGHFMNVFTWQPWTDYSHFRIIFLIHYFKRILRRDFKLIPTFWLAHSHRHIIWLNESLSKQHQFKTPS